MVNSHLRNMRQIKFRAWVRDEYMSYSHTNKGLGYLEFSNDGSTIIGEDDGDQRYENIPLMQFTNLLDKNGKEIYEGDIVFDEDGEYSKTCIIDWSDEQAKFFGKSVFDYEVYDMDEIYGEIIGNIWENEELLENK